MATSCNIQIRLTSDEGTETLNLYRHYDGYPDVAGVDLATVCLAFQKAMKHVEQEDLVVTLANALLQEFHAGYGDQPPTPKYALVNKEVDWAEYCYVVDIRRESVGIAVVLGGELHKALGSPLQYMDPETCRNFCK